MHYCRCIFIYAVLDDSQKAKISKEAGRNINNTAATGFKYSFFAFLPTIVLMLIYTILTFIPQVDSSITFIISIITRFIMGGEILGIDTGLTNYTFNAEANMMVSSASDTVVFLSSHGFIHLIFAVVTPIIFGIVFALGFKGIVSVNTTDGKKR